jgi:hypothetical protein
LIGVRQHNSRDSVISNLSQQLDQLFGAGKTVHEIDSGISGETSMSGVIGHAERLRNERDKIAPMVRPLAATGISSSVAMTQTSIRQKRLELIAKENGSSSPHQMRRTTNRAQQRSKQTWLDLPASGIDEVDHGHESTGAISKKHGETKGARRGRIAAPRSPR